MKKCAYCGKESDVLADRCAECGGADFVNPALPVPMAIVQPPPVEEPVPDPEPDVGPDEEASLCPTCLFPNVPEIHWCKKCGAPIGATVAILPLESAMAMGSVYRGAVQGKASKVVLIGLWVLFFPSLIVNCFGVLTAFLLIGTIGLRALLFLLLCAGAGAVCFSMLYRGTNNYLRKSEQARLAQTAE